MMMDWILFSIFIFDAFATDKKIYFLKDLIAKKQIPTLFGIKKEIHKNWAELLNDAVKKGDQECVKFTLDEFRSSKEENEKLIELLIKGNEKNITALHLASHKGNQTIVKLLLNVFSEAKKDKLIEYVMKENQFKKTALHYAAHSGGQEAIGNFLPNIFEKRKKQDQFIEYLMKKNRVHHETLNAKKENDEIVQLLLNVFGKEEEEKLIEYLMLGDENKHTALHMASCRGNQKIVELLLNVFKEEKKDKLIEYVMKEDENKRKLISF